MMTQVVQGRNLGGTAEMVETEDGVRDDFEELLHLIHYLVCWLVLTELYTQTRLHRPPLLAQEFTYSGRSFIFTAAFRHKCLFTNIFSLYHSYFYLPHIAVHSHATPHTHHANQSQSRPLTRKTTLALPPALTHAHTSRSHLSALTFT